MRGAPGGAPFSFMGKFYLVNCEIFPQCENVILYKLRYLPFMQCLA